LKPEHKKQTVELYDFLYRDTARIASYYAQLFKGNLTSSEKTNSETGSAETRVSASLKIVEGSQNATSQFNTSLKEISDPHDMRTVDVLSTLRSSAVDLAAAQQNDVVLVHGTLLLVDGLMVKLADSYFDTAIAAEKAKPRLKQDAQQIQNLKMVRVLMQKIDFPSAFLLKADNGSTVCGTLKNDGLGEPISTYYVKHGAAGMPDVFIIGLKEASSLSIKFDGISDFLSASQSIAKALSDSIFEPNAIRLTPISMFRRIVA
jgi:hypothetical protein